jgi:serine phosphatase RsbU (regulator of sigma subunit)
MNKKISHITIFLLLAFAYPTIIFAQNPDSTLAHQNINKFERAIQQNKIDEAIIIGSILDENFASKKLWQEQKQVNLLLAKCYEKKHQHNMALQYLKMVKTLQAKVIEAAVNNDSEKKKLNLALKKQSLKDSIQYLNQHKLAQLEIAKNNALNEKHASRKKQGYILGSLLIIVIIFVFISLRKKAKTNRLIVLQKRDLEAQKEIVENQKHILDLQQKEITKSLELARNIQINTFSSEKILNEKFGEHFILYQPKDIVSGDFYWFETNKDSLYIAAADSTGHGVPGAIVSLVNYNKLNESFQRHHQMEPHHLLDRTSTLVQEAFSNEEIQLRDGMDIALCKIDISQNKLDYAGANNPIYIIRKKEIIKFKGNKQPVGFSENKIPFEKHSFDLLKDDIIYLFSDGFQDQFGGPKNAKFKIGKFDKLLLEIHHKPLEEQKEILQETLNSWKGKEEQTDDVLVIGFKI